MGRATDYTLDRFLDDTRFLAKVKNLLPRGLSLNHFQTDMAGFKCTLMEDNYGWTNGAGRLQTAKQNGRLVQIGLIFDDTYRRAERNVHTYAAVYGIALQIKKAMQRRDDLEPLIEQLNQERKKLPPPEQLRIRQPLEDMLACRGQQSLFTLVQYESDGPAYVRLNQQHSF
ncbi:MAG TPA: hypothetical protein VJC16_04570 [Candidatus Nanoarchaeia archaeon]|nr:hypothetical protein [Candidatus Nanoarchaeia archaeon]